MRRRVPAVIVCAVLVLLAACSGTETDVAMIVDVDPQEIFFWPRPGESHAQADLTISRIGAGSLTFEIPAPAERRRTL